MPHLALAELLLNKDDLTGARTHLEQAKDHIAEAPNLQVYLGRLIARIEQTQKAEQRFLARESSHFLVKFDGDADLTTPETTHSGIFDSMGVAHLIGQGDPNLAHIGPRFPLLEEDRIALFGFHPYEIEPEESRVLTSSAMAKYPVTSMDDRPVELAQEARGRLEERARAIVVHFDVDVMDSAEIPLADWPHYDALSLGDAMRCLRVFVGSPKLAALVVTEINPDNDPDGLLVRQFVDAFADAMRPVAANAARR